MDAPAIRLQEIIRSHQWLMTLLQIVSDITEARCYIGAGAVRDVVWDQMFGFSDHDAINDIDVVYFDTHRIGGDSDAELQKRLTQEHPAVEWEVTNQAGVHLWFEDCGDDIAPYSSIEEAVASWPEHATAIAVRIDNDQFDVIAPHGLDDLLAMRVRHNPVQVSEAKYQSRLSKKRYHERWPNVEIEQ
jgi:hypothetical protein